MEELHRNILTIVEDMPNGQCSIMDTLTGRTIAILSSKSVAQVVLQHMLIDGYKSLIACNMFHIHRN